MKIIYWSDYACPYCYIGEARLMKAIKNFSAADIELEMKSFRLDPNAPLKADGDTQTRFAEKYGITFELAGLQIEKISRMGRDDGLKFNYASTLFTNTMDAHRLTKFAHSKGEPELYERIINNLFAAYFADNKELADHEVLIQAGIDAGLDKLELEKFLAGNKFQAEVLSDEQEAFAKGIRGVPFFVLDDAYALSGAQPVEIFSQAIAKALKL